jgi:hypothetical protein
MHLRTSVFVYMNAGLCFTRGRSLVRSQVRPNGSRVAVVMVNVDTTDLSWEQLDGSAERAVCSG